MDTCAQRGDFPFGVSFIVGEFSCYGLFFLERAECYSTGWLTQSAYKNPMQNVSHNVALPPTQIRKTNWDST